MSKNYDWQTKVHRVQGAQASHLIVVKHKVCYLSLGHYCEAFEVDAPNRKEWTPENGASFKTVGAAVGWTKKLLAKNGWPNPEVFEITHVQYPHEGRNITAIAVYLVKNGDVPQYARPYIPSEILGA